MEECPWLLCGRKMARVVRSVPAAGKFVDVAEWHYVGLRQELCSGRVLKERAAGELVFERRAWQFPEGSVGESVFWGDGVMSKDEVYVGPVLQYQERFKVSPEGDEHWARMLRTRKQNSGWNIPG